MSWCCFHSGVSCKSRACFASQKPPNNQECTDKATVDAPTMAAEQPGKPVFPKTRRVSVSAEVRSVSAGPPPKKIVVSKPQAVQDKLRNLLHHSVLFAGLEDEALQDVINAMFQLQVEAGATLITQGDAGDNCYVIEQGVFEAIKDGRVMHTYNHKGTFGELALLYNTRRAATIKAQTDGVVWALDGASFRNILTNTVEARRQAHEHILASVDLFKVLTPENRAAIADCLHSESHEADTVIVHQGDALTEDSKFYIVEKGELECYRQGEKGERQLVKRLTQGQWFGELALLQHSARHADVVAATKVKLLAMTRESFERLLGPLETLFADVVSSYHAVNSGRM